MLVVLIINYEELFRSDEVALNQREGNNTTQYYAVSIGLPRLASSSLVYRTRSPAA